MTPRAFAAWALREQRSGNARPVGVRVVHLCDFAAPYAGSFIPALASIRAAVDERGWSFEAVFPPHAQQHEWYAAALRSGMRVRLGPVVPRRARVRYLGSLLREATGPTILHTHFARWDFAASLVAPLARRAKPVAVIWHRHGTLSERPAPVRDVVRFAAIGRTVDAHLCVGPTGYADLIAHGAPARRTLLFPNGIDMERFPVASQEDRARARTELGLAPEETVLSAFVWDWERKGGPLLLEMVRELATRRQAVRCLLVGGTEQARAAARRVGVERWVQPVPWRSDPRAFFHAANLFVAPSVHEALGFSPLEAVCSGTPVVASDVPGHRYFGEHLAAMRLAPLSLSAMVSAVEAELDSSDRERAVRIATSREYLAQQAGLEAWSERLMALYDQVLTRRGVDPHQQTPRDRRAAASSSR